MTKALVLLSGGLDSTAALLWAMRERGEVHALFIYYGQPSGQNEVERAIAATRELGVPFNRIDIASAFTGLSTGLFQARPSGIVGGVDSAFVPARNVVLLSCAAARALSLWPGEPVELVTGFNSGDVAGFPDCSLDFVDALVATINLGLAAPARVSIATPWALHSKREIVEWVAATVPARMPLIEASWSCYRERGPCGECTACLTRARAFAR
jgi:7-cyano-7-deazaguanine synthase